MSTPSQQLHNALKRLDPDVMGTVTAAGDEAGNLRIFASINTRAASPMELVRAAAAVAFPSRDALILLREASLTVHAATEEGSFSSWPDWTDDPQHRWAKTLYMGPLSRDLIKRNSAYKRENWNTRDKVGNCIVEVGFIAPLVLDSNLQLIDGNLRLSLADELMLEDVPVIVTDVTPAQASFLRLVLNRSAEFQRWLYEDVDSFLDEWPQLAPLLEPLGFFGERILPQSFFGNSVTNYKLDPSNKQQQEYRQEDGLAKWAELQRERVRIEEELKRERGFLKDSKLPRLFELPQPTADDFLPTYDIEAAKSAFTHQMKEVAFTVTRNSDAMARARKERTGQEWQTTRGIKPKPKVHDE